MYRYELLNPRTDNSTLFESEKVFGIEVTVPALAVKCSGNLDPQHAGGDATKAAIEKALTCELPPPGTVLATIRPDLDSLGAMAILEIRLKDLVGAEVLGRVGLIAAYDTFSKGDWPGEREWPSSANPWPDGKNALAPLGILVMDFQVPLGERVGRLQDWLTSGRVPPGLWEKVEAERERLVRGISAGEVKLEVAGGVAFVETAHSAALELGYAKAPVVVARNPVFREQGSAPRVKYTIAQYRLGYLDMAAVTFGLNRLEPGWGGSPTIIGSPQGKGSGLEVETVLEVVHRFRKEIRNQERSL